MTDPNVKHCADDVLNIFHSSVWTILLNNFASLLTKSNLVKKNVKVYRISLKISSFE
jgi:hypothetical protein